MAVISLDNSEIVRSVLQVMGLNRDPAEMDNATEADVRSIIRSGLRKFYFPVFEGVVYQWRFLEKHHAIPAVKKLNTGTVAVSSGNVTLSGGTWPTDITDYLLIVDGHVLFVQTRVSDTVVMVSHTQLTVAAGAKYEAYKWKYSLPSDFGEWLGGVVYQDGGRTRMLSGSSEAEIRLRYAVGQGFTSDTTHFAITSAPDAAAMRIVFWPIPAPTAFIQGVYLSVPPDNLPTNLRTPGATIQVQPVYAEAMVSAILAAAEEYNNDTQGVHSQRFQAALRAAVLHDKAVGGAYDFSRSHVDTLSHGNVSSFIDFSSQIV